MSTTIVVSPLGRQLENTGEVIKLDILATDPELFATYDRIEVWRSTTGQGGPYDELTAAVLSPARLPQDAGSPPGTPVTGPSAVLVGEELELVVDEAHELTITFTGSDPLTMAAVAAQILAQGQSRVLAFVSSSGQLVVQTTGAGTGSSLRIKSTTAAVRLGLPVEERAYGRAPRLNLISGTERYAFEDLFGSEEYSYKVRFRAAPTGVVSEFSMPHGVGARIGLSSDRLICGKADLVQADGRPLINQPVDLHLEFNGLLVDGRLVSGTSLSKATDVNGHVEFMLVRGQKLSVSVPGTSLYRTITVPTDSSRQTFSLFDPDIAGEDIFKVQVPDLIVAERRSL